MATLVSAMGSSHAYTFLTPEEWDRRRERTRSRYIKRYNVEPSEQGQLSSETLESNRSRYAQFTELFALMRARLTSQRLDALIILGDDQDENFTEGNLPQFSIYVGDELTVHDNRPSRCDSSLATHLLHQSIEAGIDLAYSRAFSDGRLLSHAHCEPMEYFALGPELPTVPIFVNAIHVPAPTPRRCYEFGQVLADAIRSAPDGKRVAFYASGGLSHFTAGYPYRHYRGPYDFGAISTGFDAEVVACLREGRGRELATLSSGDLMANGDIELRQWIVMAGAIGDAKPQKLVYEPFYRALMGMVAGYWEMDGR